MERGHRIKDRPIPHTPFVEDEMSAGKEWSDGVTGEGFIDDHQIVNSLLCQTISERKIKIMARKPPFCSKP